MYSKLTVIAVAVLSAATLSSCTSDKVSEPFKDAGRGSSNTSEADTGTMPDGFSNYATKCDRTGIRVYVLFKSDSAYGSISTIADPSCR